MNCQEQTKIKGKGRGRVQVLAHKAEIVAAIQKGYPLKHIHGSLPSIDITYVQFYKHIQKLILANPSIALSTQKRSPSPPPRNPQQRFTETLPSKPQTFQHDPRPLKDYFAKGAGS